MTRLADDALTTAPRSIVIVSLPAGAASPDMLSARDAPLWRSHAATTIAVASSARREVEELQWLTGIAVSSRVGESHELGDDLFIGRKIATETRRTGYARPASCILRRAHELS